MIQFNIIMRVQLLLKTLEVDILKLKYYIFYVIIFFRITLRVKLTI